MRLRLLRPDQLTSEQRHRYSNRRQIESCFAEFKAVDTDGALLGPWSVFLHEPTVSEAHYGLIDAARASNGLSEAAKQVAITSYPVMPGTEVLQRSPTSRGIWWLSRTVRSARSSSCAITPQRNAAAG